MGTRARINIIDDNEILVSVYRQYDGYPSELGAELKDIANLKITNGISGDDTGTANGMGCLAAQLIAKLKERVGNVYIRNTSPDSQGEEYSYNLSERDGAVHIQVLSGSMTAFGLPGDTEAEMNSLYSGPLSDFDPDNCEEEE